MLAATARTQPDTSLTGITPPSSGLEIRMVNMELDVTVILMLISFIMGMVMGISLVRPGRSH